MFMHVGGHLNLPLGTPITRPLWFFPGVAIFFVISGYLVMDSALRSKSIADFFRNRALRIYPALALNLVVLDIVMWAAGQLPSIQYPIRYIATLLVSIATASSLIAWNVTHIPAMYTVGFLPRYPSGVLWTLTIELSFYLIVPVLAIIFARSRKIAVLVMAVAILGSMYLASYFSAAFIGQHPFLDILCPAYLWIFGIGVMLRFVWNSASWLFEDKAKYWLPTFILMNLIGYRFGLFPTGLDYHLNLNAWSYFRILFLGITVLSCAFSFKELSHKLIGQVDLSYGIYLWHMLFVTLFLANGIVGHIWLWVVVPAVTLMAAAISRYAVELPALKLKKSRIGRAIRADRGRVHPIDRDGPVSARNVRIDTRIGRT